MKQKQTTGKAFSSNEAGDGPSTSGNGKAEGGPSPSAKSVGNADTNKSGRVVADPPVKEKQSHNNESEYRKNKNKNKNKKEHDTSGYAEAKWCGKCWVGTKNGNGSRIGYFTSPGCFSCFVLIVAMFLMSALCAMNI